MPSSILKCADVCVLINFVFTNVFIFDNNEHFFPNTLYMSFFSKSTYFHISYQNVIFPWRKDYNIYFLTFARKCNIAPFHQLWKKMREFRLLSFFFFNFWMDFYFYLYTLFSFIFISWSLITLQYYRGFCHTLTWNSHGVTCVPHRESPSHLPPHPIPLG